MSLPISIRLRPAHPDDLEFAWSVYWETMRWIINHFGWDEQQEKQKFEAQFIVTMAQIIQADGEDVGWLQVKVDEQAVWLQSLYVTTAMQRKGIGSRVLKTVMDDAAKEGKRVTLSVVKINPALRLYERHGFRTTHEDEYKFYMSFNARVPSIRPPHGSTR